MKNRMLTPSELITFAVRNADHIRAAWGEGATDETTPRLRRHLARDESRTDRKRVVNGGQPFTGRQGVSRPQFATPVSSNSPFAKDQDHTELLEFLRDRLDPEHYQQVCRMLGVGERQLDRMGASYQRSDEDYPPANEGGRKGPNQGRPETPDGAAMDALTEALRNAARIAVSSYPTASQIAAERAAGQKAKSQARLAADAKRVPAARR
jgi:hypothetical protein